MLFNCSVICDSWPHELQHARIPCSSLSPGICSKSCLLSQWCHQTISSSVTPLFSCPQSFPASRTFPMSRLSASGGRSIGACFGISPFNEYSGLISFNWASLVAQMVKHLPTMQETWVQSLGWKDSPGEGNGNPLQYSCRENPMVRGAW